MILFTVLGVLDVDKSIYDTLKMTRSEIL